MTPPGDVTRPTITAAAITSTPGGDSYTQGNDIAATVTFSEDVIVVGTPTLALRIGRNTRQAAYQGGSNSTVLTFSYRVVLADSDGDGISIESGTIIRLPSGASIKDAATNAAQLTLASRVSSAQKVDNAPTGQNVPSGWALIPKDGDDNPLFTEGESFRLLFITSTKHEAKSVDIADYDGLVQTRANTNGSLRPYKGEVRALISTQEIDARAHTGTAPAGAGYQSGEGVPVYWVGGAKVADDYPDFYDGSWDSAEYRYETGTVLAEVPGVEKSAWTGSNANGTRHGNYYAGESKVQIGSLASHVSAAARNPMAAFSSAPGNDTRLYGLSPVFTVGDDTTAPTIRSASVSSDPGADNTYRAGDEIEVTIAFTEMVTVTISSGAAKPALGLLIGATTRQAVYESGSGSSRLKFTYTVVSGEEDTDGVSIPGGAALITLASGVTIKDAAATPNNANLAFAAELSAQGSHKVDAKPPVKPTDLSVTAGSGSVTLSWTDPNDASITKYQYRQKIGDAAYGNWTDIPSSGPGTAAHTFAVLTNGTQYTFRIRAVDAANTGPESAEVTATPSAADTTAPTISGVVITSNAGNDNTYKAGDAIKATVTFNEPIAVTGTPVLAIKVGTAEKSADCIHGDPTTTLVCTYTVVTGDEDTDSIEIEANKLSLNGGAIKDLAATPNNANLSHEAVQTQPAHKVDAAIRVNVEGPAGPVGESFSVSLVFSIPVKFAGANYITVINGSIDGSWVAQSPLSNGHASVWKANVIPAPPSHRGAGNRTAPFDVTVHAGAGVGYLESDTGTITLRSTRDSQFTVSADLPPVTTIERPRRSLTVTWGEVTGATGYTLQWKTAGEEYDDTRSRTVSGGTTTSAAIRNLSPATSYDWQVTPIGATPTPQTGTSKTLGAHLGLTWEAVSGATGYRVQWKSGSRQYDDARARDVSGGSVTSLLLTNLLPGTAYTWRVTAIGVTPTPTPQTSSGNTDASGSVSGPFRVDILFSEPVSGLVAEDITVTNGAVVGALLPGETVETVTVAGVAVERVDSYQVMVTPAGTGPVTVTVGESAVTDSGGNSNAEASFSVEAAMDAQRPTVTVTGPAGPVTGKFPVAIKFSEPVTGFALRVTSPCPTLPGSVSPVTPCASNDLSVLFGFADNLQGSASSYTVDITPEGKAEISVVVNAGAAVDADSNKSLKSNTYTVQANIGFVEGAKFARTVPENTPAGTDLGGPVKLTGDLGTVVLYSLGGADAGAFSIDSATGQITTKSTLDYETTTSYSITVIATDRLNQATESAGTITVTDVDEKPGITGPGSVGYREHATGKVGTYRATDPEGADVSLSLSGDDASDFTLNNAGELTFNTPPDHENPADADSDNVYRVTVTASAGGGPNATLNVAVTVTDVAEPPAAPAPTGAAATTTSLTLAWTEPANTGPPITDYDYRYRRAFQAGAWTEWMPVATSTALTATIGNLTQNRSYEVQVRATNDEGDSPWSKILTQRTRATVVTFAGAGSGPGGVPVLTRSVAENAPSGSEVGVPIAAASTPSGITFRYVLLGYESLFAINSTTGQITTRRSFNHESLPGSFDLYVEARGDGVSRRALLSIAVTDVDEPPLTPNAPTVRAGGHHRLQVSWTAWNSSSRPPVTSHDVRYRLESASIWTNGPKGVTGTSATITGLAPGTRYYVQVRATSDEGNSAWSASRTGSTTPADIIFHDVSRSVAENESAGAAVGAAVTAMPTPSGVTLEYALLSYQSRFAIDSGTGQITTRRTFNYESPSRSFRVRVEARGGGGVARATVTVTVTDVAEPPDKPATPRVTGQTSTSLTIRWTAPTAAGRPAVSGYDVQYRAGTTGQWSSHAHTGTATTTTIGSLNSGAAYQVQVRAKNAEGTGEWSDAVSGTTDAGGSNVAPTFAASTASRNVDENTAAGTAIGAAIEATDLDGDTLTYSLGGIDAGYFGIVTTSGQIQTKAALDYEAKASYTVTVTATDSGGLTGVIIVTITVTNVEEPLPAKSASLTATAGPGQAVLAWTAPADASISKWQYRQKQGSGSYGEWMDIPRSNAATTTYMVRGLTPSTAYAFQVRAVNSTGNGEASDEATVTLTANKAGVVSLISSSPSSERAALTQAWVGIGVNASLSDDDTVTVNTVTWQWAAGTVDTNDTVTWADISGATSAAYEPVAADVGKLLRVTTTYTDSNGAGQSASAETVGKMVIQPAVLYALGLESETSTVKLAEGGTVEYQLSLGDSVPDCNAEAHCIISASAISSDTTAVTSEQPKDFKFGTRQSSRDLVLTGVEDTNEVDESVMITFTLSGGGNKITVPSTGNNARILTVSISDNDPTLAMPADFTATPGNAQVVLSWSDPGDDSITGYQYRQSSSRSRAGEPYWYDEDWEDIEGSDADTVTYTVKGLSNGTLYDFQVRAVRNAYAGPASERASAMLSTSPPQATVTLSAASISENGGSATVTASLATAATAETVIVVSVTPVSPATEADYTLSENVTLTIAAGETASTGVVTITAVDNTVYAADKTVIVSGNVTAGSAIPPTSLTLTIIDDEAPIGVTFDPSAADDRSVDENSPIGTLVGSPITATATSGNVVYELYFSTHFAIDGDGQLRTTRGLDYELQDSYTFDVVARAAGSFTGLLGSSAIVEVTVNINDLDEPPAKVSQPTVLSSSPDSIGVRWTRRYDFDRPPVTSYDLQYRLSSTASNGKWSEGPQDSDARYPFHSISGLEANTSYQVQVRASNDEGDGPWSDTGTGSTRPKRPTVLFTEDDLAVRTVNENQSAGTAVGDPVTAIVSGVTYQLLGYPNLFRIDAATGQVTTRRSLNHEGQNEYKFWVQATAGDGGRGRISLVVSVRNLNETGELAFNVSSPREGEGLQVRLSDPDGAIRGDTWTWQRQDSQAAASGTPITGAASAGYTPTSTDVGKFLRVTVTYTDGSGTGNILTKVSRKVSGTPPVITPTIPFTDGNEATRSVNENQLAGTAVGAVVTATDAYPNATYELLGRGAGFLFQIDAATGQVRTGTYTLDYERRSQHRLVVQARSGGEIGRIPLVINVGNLKEVGALAFDAPIPVKDVILVARLSDPDGGVTGATWEWQRQNTRGTSSGTAITGETSRSYTPTADDVGKFLRVTVTYTDGFNSGNTLTRVSNKVADVPPPPPTVDPNPATDDSGTLRFRPFSIPTAGSPTTALLRDPDGGVTGVTWTWQRQDTQGASSGTAIVGATSASYTPIATDAGKFLRAKASYTDAGGSGKTATAVTNAVRAAPGADSKPQFAEDATSRSVFENVTPGTPVGPAAPATGGGGNALSYSLAGADAHAFTVQRSTGRIRTYQRLDYEKKRSYSVTLRVTDNRDSDGNHDTAIDDTIAVTINVLNVDEPGTVSLSEVYLYYDKHLYAYFLDGPSAVTATVTDPDRKVAPGDVTWVWERSRTGEAWTWTVIDGATSATYEAVRQDAGHLLRARAAYVVSGQVIYSRAIWVVRDNIHPRIMFSDEDGDAHDVQYHGATNEDFTLTIRFAELFIGPPDGRTYLPEPVQGFTLGDIEVIGKATLTGFANTCASTEEPNAPCGVYTVEVEMPAADGKFTLKIDGASVQDIHGNNAWGYQQTFSYDTTAPTLSFKFAPGDFVKKNPSFMNPGECPNPVSDPYCAANERVLVETQGFNFTFNFSEVVNGLTEGSLVVVGGTVTSFTDQSRTIYVTIVPNANAMHGDKITVTAPDANITDDAGNALAEPVLFETTVDDKPPKAKFALDPDEAPTGGYAVRITFNEPVRNMTGLWANRAYDPLKALTGSIRIVNGRGPLFVVPAPDDLTQTDWFWLPLEGVVTHNARSTVNASYRSTYLLVIRPIKKNQPVGVILQAKATHDQAGNYNKAQRWDAPRRGVLSFTSAAKVDVPENTIAVTTVQASDAAQTVTYAITGGADRNKFSIVETSGALTFKTAPDFESPTDADTNNRYVVQVTATSARTPPRAAVQTITVTVGNVPAPGAPGTPTVAPKAGSFTALTATWTAPDNTGLPDITGYNLQYRKGADGNWKSGPQGVTVLTADITGLQGDESYQVRVRAVSSEGNGAWSSEGAGTTAANRPPSFDHILVTTRSVAENTSRGTNIGAAVAAIDPEEDALVYALNGDDKDSFAIGRGTGQLKTKAALDFEATPTKTSYSVVVEVSDSKDVSGKRDKKPDASISITITLTNEPPPTAPAAPSVASAGEKRLLVTWAEPSGHSGSPINDYDYRYTKSSEIAWTEVTAPRIRATAVTITGLDSSTGYDVQVRGNNREGKGSWSGSGTGTTDANVAPSFTSLATVTVDENQTAATTVQAQDDNNQDDISGYALAGGADRNKFSIVETSGALTFKITPDFENPTDTVSTTPANDAGNNEYVVVVTATGGTGARTKTTDQTITVTVRNVNEPPAFANATTTRTVEENTAANTNIGDAIPAATDPDSDTLAYSMGGAAAGSFTFDTSTRRIKTRAALNYEAETSHTVTVTARDTGTPALSAIVTVTINVSDVSEKPGTMAEPTIVPGRTSLAVSWAAPTNTGPPMRYIVSYKTASAGGWTQRPQPVNDLTFTITNLQPGTPYQVRVRASNGEDVGEWSPSGSATTTTAPNAAPRFTSADAVNAAENQTEVITVAATDDDSADSVTGYALTGGADQGKFSIVAGTGVLTFQAAPNFEIPTDTGMNNTYVVEVTATSGAVGRAMTAAQNITVTVTNVNEAPSFSPNTAARSVDENSSSGSNVGAVIPVAMDLDAGDSLSYGLGGADAGSFNFNASTRRITVGTALNYEARTSYTVTVTATDQGGLSDTVTATITVTDLEEAGTVTFNALTPKAGTLLTARLSDPDSGVSGLSWRWASASTSTGTYANIAGATSAGYRPVAGDVGKFLRATASYTDRRGSGKTADATTTAVVAEDAPQVRLSVSPTTIDEQGASNSATLTARIPSAYSSGDITIAVSASPPGAVTLSANTLTITSGQTSATLTVTAVDNDVDAPDARVTLSGSVSSNNALAPASVTLTITDDEIGPPAPPANLRTTPGDQRVTLRWDDPNDDTITSYQYSRDGGRTWQDIPGSDSETTSHTVTGLENGDEYDFVVRAVNPKGMEISPMVKATPRRPIAPPPLVPSGPTPSEIEFEWNVKRDVELHAANDEATGLWSDGSTLWVAHNAGGGGRDAVFAYDIESGERVEEREIALDERNRAPRGLCSDGEALWVSDSGGDRLFAYDIESGERLPARDLEFARDNGNARGIWCYAQRAWVVNAGTDSVFVYDQATSALIAEYALDSSNGDPRGIWSDGVTVWVADHGAKRLFAYRLPALPAEDAEAPEEPPALERVRELEFTRLSRAGNNSPRGIWSDGDLMYVVDQSADKVYTYNMPDAIDARLASLTLSDVDIGEFSPARTDYEGTPDEGVTETTVAAELVQSRADMVIDPPDANGEADGHQVALQGLGEITVTVTSPDGSRTRVYRVRFGDGREPCLRGAIAEGFSLVVFAGGGIEELAACAEGRGVTVLYVLHDGVYVSYILGAPDFVNRPFRELFPEGVPPLTPLLAGSAGPPSDAPAAASVSWLWPECLRGDIVTGFSLVVYKGGSIEELASCAQGRGVTALYALHDGVYVSYILGAPDFVNRPFRELFPERVPPLTPLTVKSDGPAAGDAGGEDAAGN